MYYFNISIYCLQYCKDPAIRALCCVGGANIRDQIEALESGIDIVTGTPGRLGVSKLTNRFKEMVFAVCEYFCDFAHYLSTLLDHYFRSLSHFLKM